MLGQYTYLALMIGTIIVPFLMSFEKKVHFISNLISFIKSNAITLTVFIIWDVIFTAYGVWSFNPDYHIGFDILGLPLEEWMFFICVPYACMFIYEIVNKLFGKFHFKAGYYFSITLISLLIMILILFENGIYTQITFILLTLLLLLSMKRDWISNFHLSYLICLIPFAIVNGILTYLPVVLYNDNENLSIRIVSIPFEDIFYGMAMVLMNIYLFELFKKKDD